MSGRVPFGISDMLPENRETPYNTLSRHCIIISPLGVENQECILDGRLTPGNAISPTRNSVSVIRIKVL